MNLARGLAVLGRCSHFPRSIVYRGSTSWSGRPSRNLHAASLFSGHCKNGLLNLVQIRLRHGSANSHNHGSSRSGRNILSGLMWCIGITGFSYYGAYVFERQSKLMHGHGHRRVDRSAVVLAGLATFGAVYCLGLVTIPHFRRWFDKRFFVNGASFRPAQLLGATLNHLGALHLILNGYAFIHVMSLEGKAPGRSPYFAAALILSSSAWVNFAMYLAMPRLLPYHRICGSSSGLLAVLGSQYFLPDGYGYTTCANTAKAMAIFDVTLLALTTLRIFDSPISHMGHLMGLGFGVLFAKLNTPQQSNIPRMSG